MQPLSVRATTRGSEWRGGGGGATIRGSEWRGGRGGKGRWGKEGYIYDPWQ